MSASQHLHPYQLSLFVQAKDLMDTKAGDFGGTPMSQRRDAYERKLRESSERKATPTHDSRNEMEPTLLESIKEHGVQKPVELDVFRGVSNPNEWQEWLFNGHHRVASAHSINPDMWLPVTYLPLLKNEL